VRSKARLLVAFSLLAAAGSAASQAPDPAPPPQERSAAPGPRLNLKLDKPADYARETPREGAAGGADGLPSLGANARPMPATPTPTTTRPFPADSERGER